MKYEDGTRIRDDDTIIVCMLHDVAVSSVYLTCGVMVVDSAHASTADMYTKIYVYIYIRIHIWCSDDEVGESMLFHFKK